MLLNKIANQKNFEQMIANMVDSILDGDNDTSFPMNDLDIETILMHFEEQNNKCANCTVNCGNSINCNS